MLRVVLNIVFAVGFGLEFCIVSSNPLLPHSGSACSSRRIGLALNLFVVGSGLGRFHFYYFEFGFDSCWPGSDWNYF